MNKTLSACALACALTLGGAAQADAIGLDFVSGSTGWTIANGDSWTLGYQFTVNSTTQLSGLGFWDAGNGFNTTRVGIWDTSGTLLGSIDSGSAAVTSFVTGNGLGTWNFMDFSMSLSAGSYVVGAWGDGMEYAFNSTGGDAVISTSGMMWDNWREKYGGVFQYPADIIPYGNEFRGFWGANVRFGDGSQVPEPGTLALVGLSLAGLAGASRPRRD